MIVLSSVALLVGLVLAVCAGALHVKANPDRFITWAGMERPVEGTVVSLASGVLLIAGQIGLQEATRPSALLSVGGPVILFSLFWLPCLLHNRRLREDRGIRSTAQ